MDNQQANESVQAAIIERWRQSSPWEQGRLDILKEAVAHGVEERLYDTEEQQKYGLGKDEFLLLACWHGLPLTNNWWYQYFFKYILMPCIFILTINGWFAVHVKSFGDKHFYGIPWDGISVAAGMVSVLSFFILAFFLFGNRYLLLTNRALHFGRKIRQMSRIPLNGLLIRSSIDKTSVSRGTYLYENISGSFFTFIIDIFVFRDSQHKFSAHIGLRGFDRKRQKGIFQFTYILHALSYMSRQYNHGLYVLPLRCGFTCDRKDYVYSKLNVCLGLVLDVFYWNKRFRLDIEKNFSDKRDIETYLTGQKIAGCNNNTIISLLRNGTDSDGELFWVPAIKEADGKTYKIHVAAKEVWLESNGLKTSDILSLTDIEIYHSHKYFIFLFPDKDKYIAYYVWKKDLFFPFLDIMEIILKEKIAYMGSGYVAWDS